MKNNIKGRSSKEAIIQLKRAKVQKKLLIKNIYKEYEIYFHIVRKSIFTSAEKGIFGLYSDMSTGNQELDIRELNNFINKNISLLIYSKLPLITIEQLKLEDSIYHSKKSINVNALKELVESKNNQSVDFVYENNSLNKEALEFRNNFNTYEYYETLNEDKLTSVNLDENDNLNYFSKQDITKKIENETDIGNLLEIKKEINCNKLNENENINIQISDALISCRDLNIFEFIDKSFSNLLLNLSYIINSELLKKNLIKKFISEDTFKRLSTSNYIIKHPHPFVIRFDLNSDMISIDNNKSYNIDLFAISKVELEFYNLDLSICSNNINELKSKLRLLCKKEKYWQNKELALNSSK